MSRSPAAILYDALGNAIKVVQDGTDYLLGVAAKIRNSAGTVINPATQEQLPSSPGQTTKSASLPVTLASDQTPPENSITTGSITSIGQSIEAACGGWQAHYAILSGTWTGTLVAELSTDGGVTWTGGAFFALPPLTPLPSLVIFPSESGSYQFVGTSEANRIRVTAISPVTGTIEVKIILTQSPAQLASTFSLVVQSSDISDSNSSNVPLASRGTFTGVADGTLGYSGIQISFIADQPCLVHCEQSTDGVNWDIDDEYPVEANVGDARTIQVVADFFRVKVDNLAYNPCTYLRLQPTLRPIVEAVPRSLGAKKSSESLSVTVASDQILPVAARNTDGNPTDFATEETLYAIKGIQLTELLSEMRQVRKLMEILTDESVMDEE